MNHGTARTPPAYGHRHGVEHQLAVNRRTRRPADDLAREEIHDDGEIEPALPRPNIGDIRRPDRARPRDGETPLQQVGDQDGWFADRPASDAVARYSVQMLCRVLEVAVSGYYEWLKQRISNHDQEKDQDSTQAECDHGGVPSRGRPHRHRERLDLPGNVPERY